MDTAVGWVTICTSALGISSTDSRLDLEDVLLWPISRGPVLGLDCDRTFLPVPGLAAVGGACFCGGGAILSYKGEPNVSPSKECDKFVGLKQCCP